jgi:hypothetical protein
MEDKSPFTDSAGVPWAGRSFSENSFSSDDGSADKNLIAAINEFRSGSGSAEAVVKSFAQARLLIPLVANLGESDTNQQGLKVDKSAELSIVTVQAPDGQRALPVFSSVETMKSWNPEARPVPNFGQVVAVAAASEGNTRIVLDPTAATEFVIRRPAIAALAQGLPWRSPENNPELKEILASLLSEFSIVKKFELSSNDPLSRLEGQELLITLHLENQLAKSEIEDFERKFFSNLSTNSRFVDLVDSIAVRYLAS